MFFLHIQVMSSAFLCVFLDVFFTSTTCFLSEQLQTWLLFELIIIQWYQMNFTRISIMKLSKDFWKFIFISCSFLISSYYILLISMLSLMIGWFEHNICCYNKIFQYHSMSTILVSLYFPPYMISQTWFYSFSTDYNNSHQNYF